VYLPLRPFYLVFDHFIYQKQEELSKRQYLSKAKGSNFSDFLVAKNTVRSPAKQIAPVLKINDTGSATVN
jgi:hypothetical protein